MKEETTMNQLPPEVCLPSLSHPDKDSSWRDSAKCKGVDVNVFYPVQGGNGTIAKLICYGCSVRKQCAEFAINNSMRDGIYGGLTEKERRKVSKGIRTTNVTLAEVLRCAFFVVNNTYPRKDDPWFYRYSKDVISAVAKSTGLKHKEIYDNIDNAHDYVL